MYNIFFMRMVYLELIDKGIRVLELELELSLEGKGFSYFWGLVITMYLIIHYIHNPIDFNIYEFLFSNEIMILFIIAFKNKMLKNIIIVLCMFCLTIVKDLITIRFLYLKMFRFWFWR